jgi:oxygen-dependent protoporphyrinogen oxidase
MTKKNPSVGILGAGISGLTTAYALSQKNIPVTVYEKSDTVGGSIRSIQKDGWLVEEGPNTLMVKSQALWDFIDDLGLNGKLQEANQVAKQRFVVKDQKPTPIPMSLGDLLTTPLLSIGAKLRLLKEPFVAPSIQFDESVASFFRRRLGEEPLNYGVNPFVSGIYAGVPELLSIKHTFSSLWEMDQEYGSLLKGAFRRRNPNSSTQRALISFEEGNQTLPKTISKRLQSEIHLSTRITSIKQTDEQWIVNGLTKKGEFEALHDCLVSTIPTHTLPTIFKSDLTKELAEIPYAPMSVLALGFKKDNVHHPLDGFGMLIPEVENFNLLGCLFSSTLFPGRAPDDHHLLTCFIGGARNPDMASKPKKELQSTVLEELNQLLGVDSAPVFSHHKYWQKAIPQYVVGYDRYLSLIDEIESKNRGLFLDGNFRDGVSVPDCISSGFNTAQKVRTFLRSI